MHPRCDAKKNTKEDASSSSSSFARDRTTRHFATISVSPVVSSLSLVDYYLLLLSDLKPFLIVLLVVKCIKIRTQKKAFLSAFRLARKKEAPKRRQKPLFFGCTAFFCILKQSFYRSKIHSTAPFSSSSDFLCQKKEASLTLVIFIIVFARINTRTTYTLRSGKQPTLKKKSPREEDICVHK